MTLSLLLVYLVEQLFREAALSIQPDNFQLKKVLLAGQTALRATRFTCTGIWVEHLS